MSHNSYKIGSAEPNALSVLSARIEDMSNVSTSDLAINDVLVYDSATQTWSNQGSISNAILIGRGESNAYTNCGISVAVGNAICFYDSAPLNSIAGATINYATGTSWVQSVTLLAGTYYITAQTVFVFSASGSLAFRATDTSSTIYSSLAVIGASLSTYGGASTTLQGVAKLTGTTTLRVQIAAMSNVSTAANQGNTPAESGVLFIRKVA